MYGVLGVLFIVMGVYSALNDRLPWSRRIGRYKIELLPLADEENESATAGMAYPMAVVGPEPWRRSYREDQKSQESVIIDPEKNLQSKDLATTLYQNRHINEQTTSSSNPSVPGAQRRCIRTYGSLKGISSPVKSFINETFVNLYLRKKRKKKRRRPKINSSISELNISNPGVKSAYVRATFPKANGPKCPCELEIEQTTRPKFILTPCECESDYEITDQTERNEDCEETVADETSTEEYICEECALEQADSETPCTEETTEPCCQLDPIPKHSEDDSDACPWLVTQTSEDPQDEYPTYKPAPISGCKHKKKPAPRCNHSETTLEKSDEPDLRKIFNLSESTINMKKSKHRTTYKKNEKNKIRRKFSKAKRKSNRVAHFKCKDVTKKNTKNSQFESFKKYAIENILSRIKGRTNMEGSATHNGDEAEDTTEASDEPEGVGCHCGGNVVSNYNDKTYRTETSVSHNTKKITGNFEEMFKKFMGELAKEATEKGMTTDTSSKDNSVTLIINMEDEVIVPPEASKQTLNNMNPLSVAVQQMLEVVKSKMTEAVGATSTEPVRTTTAETAETEDTDCEIITAERLKILNPKRHTTHEPSSKLGLLCTHCHKYNEISIPPEAENFNVKATRTRPTTVTTTITTEETTCMEESIEEAHGELEEVTHGSHGSKDPPVTDADYDQIISHIQCNYTEEPTRTIDILKQLCENRYGAVTTSVNRKSPSQNQKGTTKGSHHDETQVTFDISPTQISRRKGITTSVKKQSLPKYLTEAEVASTTSDDSSETNHSTTHDICKDEKTHITMKIKDKMTTNDEETSVIGRKKETNLTRFTKHKEASETMQTICFPISDFVDTVTISAHHKTAKTTGFTKLQKEDSSIRPNRTKEITKETTKELDDMDSSPRPCNCTPQVESTLGHRTRTHDHSHHHTFFFHRHSTTSHEPRTHPIEEKSSSHKEVSSTDSEVVDTSVSQVDDKEESEETEETTTAKSTTGKSKKTTTIKLGKEKDRPLRPQKYKFYPPLSLYRTWLSPWAAVQIQNPAPRYKPDHFNNYTFLNDDHDMIKLPHQPFPGTGLDVWTTDSAIKLPPELGKEKGVYVGAIVLGNKNLPAGFYKLEDLKKLKNSGISLPKIRGKKTLIGDKGIVYSLRRLLPHIRFRGKHKRKIVNNCTSSGTNGDMARNVLDQSLNNNMRG